MLDDAVQDYLDAIEDEDAEVEEVFSKAQAIVHAAPEDPVEINRVLPELADGMYLSPHLLRVGVTAWVCGNLVNQGGDPELIAAGLIKHFPDALSGTYEFLNACYEQMDEQEAQAFEEEEELPDRLLEEFGQDDKLREAMRAYQAMQFLWPPTMTVLMHSAEARGKLRPLHNLCRAISGVHRGAHWLRYLLASPDEEPVLIIEPETCKGFRGKLSGAADNFQLNLLLAAELIGNPAEGWLKGEPLSPELADLARGIGPQELEGEVTGQWQLFNWEAVQPDRSLPDWGDEYWIWNEGIPADISLFDGYRVILLAPPAYPRSWSATRLFAELPASLTIEEKLSRTEVIDWLHRMAEAERDEPENWDDDEDDGNWSEEE